jgi:hypothetical protein
MLAVKAVELADIRLEDFQQPDGLSVTDRADMNASGEKPVGGFDDRIPVPKVAVILLSDGLGAKAGGGGLAGRKLMLLGCAFTQNGQFL